MAYHVGDVWKPKATITNPESATPETPVEPGSVAFVFESPKGVKSTGTPTKVEVGVWRSEQELTERGEWKVSVTTTAPYKASEPEQISVKGQFEV
jgi:hypothetical protein